MVQSRNPITKHLCKILQTDISVYKKKNSLSQTSKLIHSVSLQRPLVPTIGRTSKRRLVTCFSTPTLSQSAQCRSRPTDRGRCAVARTVTSQAPKLIQCFRRLPQCISQSRMAQRVHRRPGHCSCSKVPQLCVAMETQLHANGFTVGTSREFVSANIMSGVWTQLSCQLRKWGMKRSTRH